MMKPLVRLILLGIFAAFLAPRSARSYYNLFGFIKAPLPAIAFVQSTGEVKVNTGTTVSATFSALPKVGNTVVIYAWSYFGTASPTLTAADNQTGNSYSSGCSNTNSTDVVKIIYSRVVGAAGSFTVTLTSNKSGGEIIMIATEYSGLSAAPLDVFGSTSGNSTSPQSGSTGVTHFATELIAGVMSWDYGGSGETITLNAPFTSRGIETNGATAQIGGAAERIVTTTGNYSAAWSSTGATANTWIGCAASFH